MGGIAGKILRRAGLSAALNRFVDWVESGRRVRRRLPFYGRFVSPGALCFDVGANLGDRAELFLELGARVVCVEPMESCGRVLREKFGERDDVYLVAKGLAGAEGELEIFFSEDATDVSSMSRGWIDAVSDAPRLARPMYHWDDKRTVAVTTLDRLIEEFGVPDFCKIDVEGFEYEVLLGLSRPLPALSFEFTPERPGPAAQCIERLESLGDCRFNYSRGDNMRLDFAEWVLGREVLEYLEAPRAHGGICGDIYAVENSHSLLKDSNTPS